MKFPHNLIAAMALALFVFASPSYGTDIPAVPEAYVVDLAGIIDPGTEAKLNGILKELEQKTTAQVVVLTVESLDGRSIEDFSIDVAHGRWKLGQKGRDNGVLILVSTGERKYRIEAGYGLEGVLPDSLAGSIGRTYMRPYFQKGDFSGGILAGALAVSGEIASSEGVELTGLPALQRQYAPRTSKPGIVGTAVSILFFLLIVLFAIKYPRLFLFFLIASSMGGRRGHWGGGGGFGGGGGGFGGGGGGGFGGGGASGGW